VSIGVVTTYTFDPLDNDHTITVTYKIKNYTVITKASPVEGGTTSGDGTYSYNELVTITATVNEGYQFVKWTETSEQGFTVSTNLSFQFNIKCDTTFVANYKRQEYNITYEVGVVTIGNTSDLPTTYTVDSHATIPDAEATHDFYVFSGWHLDSPDGAIVHNTDDLGGGNHTLYADFSRYIPGAEMVISLGRLLAVRNANDYDVLRTAKYAWSKDGVTLPGVRHYVEVGEPIPGGYYKVVITIDEEMPAVLERTFAPQAGVYPNPVSQYDIINIVSENDHMEQCEFIDASGKTVTTRAIRTAIGYQVEIPVGTGVYTLKLKDTEGHVSIHKIIVK
jgi:hypothetical protein